MADNVPTNRLLIIKRHEHSKLVALANIQAREIRIMELQEEIARQQLDIQCQGKVIVEAEFNIKQQNEEIEKEKERKKDQPEVQNG